MTQRLLYLERADRGDRLAALRLVGPRTQDVWHAGAARGIEDALAAVTQAAAWTRDRLQGSDRASLSAICLDPDGSLCSWLTSTTEDPTVLAAVARGASEAHHGEHEEAAAPLGPRALDHFGAVGSGMSIQAIGGTATADPAANGHARAGKKASPDAAARRRLTILGVSDSAPAMLIDALDQAGIAAPTVITLWHAMARAWDPAARDMSQAPRADRLVADTPTVTAVVVVEPAGRLTWAWSRDGDLLTGGMMRLPRGRAGVGDAERGSDARHVEGAPVPRLDAAHAARLAADWLAWSAQTGAAPSRVVVVTPERLAGMQVSDLAGALVRAWPSAAVDLITDDDPVLFTLQRAMGEDGSSGAGALSGEGAVAALANRPARAHRAMYTWGALAIAGLGLAAGAVAVTAWRTASSARDRADAKRRETSALALDHFPDPMAFAPGIILSLEDELARLQAEGRPADTSEFKPVLQETQNIAMVVSSLIASSPRSRFVSLNVDNALPTRLVVQLPDLTTYERVRDALRDAGVSDLVWSENPQRLERPNPEGGTMLETTFIATWRLPPGPGGATTGGTP